MAPQIVLASNSPRRRQLLALTGWGFLVRPADIDEQVRPNEQPSAYVLRLAEEKAKAVKPDEDGQIILAADTTVTDGVNILGKPADSAEARQMLRSLRGRDHWVYTAIGVFQPATGRIATDLCGTRVWMREYSDAEIEAYIESGDPFDKAGAYAIQNAQFHPVERIEGCYACVVGLAVCRVVTTLRTFGLNPPNDVTRDCQNGLNSDCQIYREIFIGG